MRLGEPADAPERDARAAPSFVGGEAVRTRQLARFQIDVESHLRVDVAIERVAVHERAQASREEPEGVGHGV
jgi:hypothetical protein